MIEPALEFQSAEGTAELARCLTLCAWMAGCWVLRYALHSVSTSLSHHAAFHVLANTRVRLLDKLAALPLGTVLDRSSGSYKNIIVERVDSIETTLAHLLPEMTANIAGALAVLVLLFMKDWRMGLSMFIVVPLGIARAMLKDAPVVILDEATANVDPENEKELMEAVRELTHNKTVIMIAHRLKTVRNADQIFVVDHGEITQQGTHDDLINADGLYRRFVVERRQAAGWKV